MGLELFHHSLPNVELPWSGPECCHFIVCLRWLPGGDLLVSCPVVVDSQLGSEDVSLGIMAPEASQRLLDLGYS